MTTVIEQRELERQQRVSAEHWVFGPGTFEVPVTAFVGVHPMAGVTTWAHLLDGADAGMEMPPSGEVVAVTRSTPAGLGRMKELVQLYGAARFRAVLVVADAQGRMTHEAARQVKILSGAVKVIEVPWIKALRGAVDPAAVATQISRPVGRVQGQLDALSGGPSTK